MSESILITGASGFVGHHAVKFFLEKGLLVKALTRSGKNLAPAPDLELIFGDVRDHETVLRATKGVNWILHLAAAKQDEADSFETNVGGAENLVKAAHGNGVRFIVNISTSSTKINRRGVYGESKRQADEVIMNGGIPATTLKPSIIYGDLSSGVFGSLVKYGGLPITPIFGPGECLFRPIHVLDLLKAIEIAARKVEMRGKTYDIGGPDIVCLDSLVKRIGEIVLVKNVRLLHLPAGIGMAAASLMSVCLKKSPLSKSNILGSTQNIEMNYNAFIEDFQFTPMDLATGLYKTIHDVTSKNEAAVILRYIGSRSLPRITITSREIELFQKALALKKFTPHLSPAVLRFPVALGGLDFLSLFFKKSLLRKKLRIASAIIECSPCSAEWLLPKRRSPIVLALLSIYLGLNVFIKMALASVLLFLPKFVKSNVS